MNGPPKTIPATVIKAALSCEDNEDDMYSAATVLDRLSMFLSQLLWQIAPIYIKRQLILSVPPARADAWLVNHINGSWSLDGGIIYLGPTRPPQPYQDIHQYSGVVDHGAFNLSGPFSVGNPLPMIIEGEIAVQSGKSVLIFSIRTSLLIALYKMLRSIIGLLLYGLFFALLLWYWGIAIRELITMGVLVLLCLTLFCTVTYVTVVRQVHRQVNLLLNQFRTWANEQQ